MTGAAGFIGSILVESLLERGDTVVGVDDFNDFYSPAVKRANLAKALRSEVFSLRTLDICDGDRLKALFEETRPEVVVHLAARAGVRPSLLDPNAYNRVNVLGTQNVLDCCVAVRPSHLVAASSSSVYGGIAETPFREDMDISRPVSPYAATKRMNELMAHVYSHVHDLHVTLLRFFTVYGPRQRPDMAIHRFVRLVEAGEPVPMFGDGLSRRDYTYVADIVEGVVRAVDRPFRFEIINLGEQRTTSLRELIGIVEAHVGRAANVEPRPPQPGDVDVTYADVTKARDLLGYETRTPVDEGIGLFVKWWRGRHAG